MQKVALSRNRENISTCLAGSCGRSQSGNMTTIVILCTLAIVIVAVVLVQLGAGHITRQRQVSALEAASLAAACEVSKLVVDDQYFGYIGLADQPPAVSGTAAGDGEPLPIRSINTILANCRLQLLVADQVGNPQLNELARQDLKEARRACREIEQLLAGMVLDRQSGKGKDAQGRALNPFQCAERSYRQSLGILSIAGDGNFRLKLGWLEGNYWTTTPVAETSLSKGGQCESGQANYPACVDVPAVRESFFFAPVGKTASLVPVRSFRLPDGKRVCSVICAEVDIEDKQGGKTTVAACAQPWGGADRSPPPLMLMSFPSGLVAGADSLHSLLCGSYSDVQVRTMSASMGDYPKDKNAQLVPLDGTARRTVSTVVAEALHDWLRAVGTAPRLESVVEIVRTPFSTAVKPGPITRQNIAAEVDSKGNVLLTNRTRSPFINQVVHENQIFSMSVPNGSPAQISIFCRNQVRNLGHQRGGKHGGQALPGNPVNWGELAYFGESQERALSMGRGSDCLKLLATGSSRGCAGGKSAVSLGTVQFKTLDQKEASPQPRKTYYSGGLAAEIQIERM